MQLFKAYFTLLFISMGLAAAIPASQVSKRVPKELADYGIVTVPPSASEDDAQDDAEY